VKAADFTASVRTDSQENSIPILDFLRALRDNNCRKWFVANRLRYEVARADFLSIVGDLLGRLDSVCDLGGIALKDCVFRINRDLRFSKDKTPYKTAMSTLNSTRSGTPLQRMPGP
jgi:uncharacterized protein (TIGR02453 family)